MNITKKDGYQMAFKMNKGVLEFLKFKKKNSKDECFATGYILGVRSSLEMFAELNGVEADNIDEMVDGALPDEEIIRMWNGLAEELELDLRDPEIVGLVKL